MEQIRMRFWEANTGEQEARKYDSNILRKMLIEQTGITEKCELEYAEVFSVSNLNSTMESKYLAQSVYPKKELDFIILINEGDYALIYFYLITKSDKHKITLFDTIHFKQ